MCARLRNRVFHGSHAAVAIPVSPLARRNWVSAVRSYGRREGITRRDRRDCGPGNGRDHGNPLAGSYAISWEESPVILSPRDLCLGGARRGDYLHCVGRCRRATRTCNRDRLCCWLSRPRRSYRLRLVATSIPRAPCSPRGCARPQWWQIVMSALFGLQRKVWFAARTDLGTRSASVD